MKQRCALHEEPDAEDGRKRNVPDEEVDQRQQQETEEAHGHGGPQQAVRAARQEEERRGGHLSRFFRQPRLDRERCLLEQLPTYNVFVLLFAK